MRRGIAAEKRLSLDATLVRLVEDLPEWARQQLAELEARVGPCADTSERNASQPRAVAQNLWT